jgi:hypothetical protein
LTAAAGSEDLAPGIHEDGPSWRRGFQPKPLLCRTKGVHLSVLNMGDTMPSTNPIPLPPVYEGPVPIGQVAQRGGQFEAVPTDGRSLGLFNRFRAATDAIFFHAQQRRCRPAGGGQAIKNTTLERLPLC